MSLRNKSPFLRHPANALRIGQRSDAVSDGGVPGVEYQWGTHAGALFNAEGLKSHIWAALVGTAIVTSAVASFISAPEQAYANPLPTLFESVSAGQTPPVIQQIFAAPAQVDLTLRPSVWKSAQSVLAAQVPPFTLGQQAQVDLTLQGWVRRGAPGFQGDTVRPFAAGLGQLDLTQQGSIWKAAFSTLPGTLGQFFSVAPTQLDYTLQGWIRGPAASALSFAVPPIFASPAQFDLSLQGWIRGAAPGTRGPTVSPLFASPAQADFTQQGSVWSSATGPAAVASPVAEFLSAAPEQFALPLQGWIRGAAPGTQGPSIAQFFGGPPLADFTLQGSIWKASFPVPVTFQSAWTGNATYVTGVVIA